MPRLKSIQVSALNITIQPHTPALYINLLDEAFGQARPFRFRANHYAMFGSMHAIDSEDPLAGVHGEIYRFLDFDPEEPWLNLEAQKAADEKDLRQIRIPEHLKPGFSSARYAFFPAGHRFFFERMTANRKGFGQKTVKDIVWGLLNEKSLREKYGEVDVTIEPAREALDKIFAIHRLKTLDIVLLRPNPDDHEDAERKVLERMDAQKARRLENKLTAASGMGLEPDEQTRILASIAASNGKVVGIGKDSNNARIEESTVDHPWEQVIQFNPKTQGAREVFLEKVKGFARRFGGRQRGQP